MDPQELLSYRLARSAIGITGSVTRTPFPGASERVTQASTVTLIVEGDRAGEATFDVPESNWKSTKLELDLAADGRLTGASATIEGAGSVLVGAGVQLASVVAATVAAPAIEAAAAAAGEPADPGALPDPAAAALQAAYATAFPDQGAARAALQKALSDLETALAAKARIPPAPADLTPWVADLKAVSNALGFVRKEAEQIETHFDSWRATYYPVETETYEFRARVSDLPAQEVFEPTLPKDFATGDAQLEEAKLRLNVVVVRATEPGAPPAPPVPGTNAGIYFRRPRWTNLAVYARRRPGEPFHLQRTLPVLVVDATSPLTLIPVTAHLFNEKMVTVETSDAGTMTRLGIASTAAAAAVAEAIEKTASGAASAVAGVQSIVSGVEKLRTTGADQRLADLKTQKATLQAEIALKGISTTASQKEELARLTAEDRLLTKLKQLHGDLDAVNSTSGDNS